MARWGNEVAELIEESGMKVYWNVLNEKWLDTMATGGQTRIGSPLEVLSSPSSFRCLTASNPLDLFAAHRFLLTLLYWKSDAGGGAEQVRKSLPNGSSSI